MNVNSLSLVDLTSLVPHFRRLSSFHEDNYERTNEDYKRRVIIFRKIDEELKNIKKLKEGKRINYVKQIIKVQRFTIFGTVEDYRIKNNDDLIMIEKNLLSTRDINTEQQEDNIQYMQGQEYLWKTYQDTYLSLIWEINSRIFPAPEFEELKRADINKQTFIADPIQSNENKTNQRKCYEIVDALIRKSPNMKMKDLFVVARIELKKLYGLDLTEANIKVTYSHALKAYGKKKVKDVKQV